MGDGGANHGWEWEAEVGGNALDGGPGSADPKDAMRAIAASSGGGIYMGAGLAGPAWAPPRTSLLVLGPTGTGKTSCIVVPAICAAQGPVVSTSTKTDVLEVTAALRRRLGPCFVYDPSGTVRLPRGVEMLRWSPLAACRDWTGAQLAASNLSKAARLVATSPSATSRSADTHWDERAASLLAALMHAAALGDLDMAKVISWVDRHQGGPASGILEEAGADELACDLLQGLLSTDSRELSGIWSTASGMLGAYRTRPALETALDASFDPAAFAAEKGTIYVCATGRHQALAAPLIVELLNELKEATYSRYATAGPDLRARMTSEPMLFALDEVANIAPLPDLPAIVSEGGGQGLVALACLQDLSQASARWGVDTTGMLTQFTTTVMLPGITHVPTLQAFSALAGDVELPTVTISTPAQDGPPPGGWRRAPWSQVAGLLTGGRPAGSVTTSTTFRPRLGVEDLSKGARGTALVLGGGAHLSTIGLTPWFSTEPWSSHLRAARALDAAEARTRALHTKEAGARESRSGHGQHLGTGQAPDQERLR